MEKSRQIIWTLLCGPRATAQLTGHTRHDTLLFSRTTTSLCHVRGQRKHLTSYVETESYAYSMIMMRLFLHVQDWWMNVEDENHAKEAKKENNIEKGNTKQCTNRYVGKKVLCFWLSCVHCVQYSEKKGCITCTLDIQGSFLTAPGGYSLCVEWRS